MVSNIDQSSETLTVGLAQMAPVWLNREKTLEKMIRRVQAAADQGCRLVAFGEALLPGYSRKRRLLPGRARRRMDHRAGYGP